jgi:hypothetical protein
MGLLSIGSTGGISCQNFRDGPGGEPAILPMPSAETKGFPIRSLLLGQPLCLAACANQGGSLSLQGKPLSGWGDPCRWRSYFSLARQGEMHPKKSSEHRDRVVTP